MTATRYACVKLGSPEPQGSVNQMDQRRTAQGDLDICERIGSGIENGDFAGIEETYFEKSNGNHNECTADRTSEAFKIPRTQSELLLIFLLAACLVFFLLLPYLYFITLQPSQTHKTFGERLNETSMPSRSHKSGKVWVRTERLLAAINLLYDHTTRPVTLYQPETYEDLTGGQRWYFKAVRGHGSVADVEMFVHNSVQRFQLALKHPTGAHTVYHIALQPHPRIKSTHISLPATPVEASDDCLVVNLSGYLNDWVAKGSEFSILFESPGNDSAYGRKDTGFPQHFRHSLLQPVVSVLDRNTYSSREEGDLQDVLKETLAGKMALKITQIEATKERNLLPNNRHRRSADGECKMSMVSISLDELGLENIVYPTHVDMKFCLGSCHVIDDPAMFSTNALMRVKYKFLRGSAPVPSPQCTPTVYKYLPFIIWQKGKLRRVGVSDLDATICGCR